MIEYQLDEKRFWSKVVKTEKCWLWNAYLNKAGYGTFRCLQNGKKSMALTNRISYFLANGPIPEGVGVSSTCLNHACVNPAHLFLATAAEKTKALKDKGHVFKAGGGRPPKDPKIRFWSKVNKTDTCWLWTAGLFDDGYGAFKENGNLTLRAHRYSYILAKGPIPEGKVVMHSCNTPTCVNPDHLSVGTPAENSADMVAQGRSLTGDRNPAWGRKGEEANGSKLTQEQANEIRALAALGTHTNKEIGDMYGVSATAVSNIRNNQRWV